MYLYIDQIAFNYIYFTEMAVNALLFLVNIGISAFLIAEFRKHRSIFHSPYFYILNSFYCLRIPYNVIWVYGRTSWYQQSDPLLPFILLFQWYTQSCQGIWEASLGLCRCTALAFPKAHKLLWSGKRYLFFIALIYLFPFIVNGDMFSRFDCKFMSSPATGCLQYRRDTNTRVAAMTIALNLLCLAFVLIGIIFSPKGFHKAKKSKMEYRLIFQTVLSATSMALLYAETFIGFFTETKDYLITSYIFWMVHYYPPMFIIFFITPTIRGEFIAFWLSRLCLRPTKIMAPSPSLFTVVSIQPAKMHSR